MRSVSVVVPYRPGDPHRDRLWAWCGQWWFTWFPHFEIVLADTDHGSFNRGAARNAAADAATGDVLIVADADTIPEARAIHEALAMLADKRAPYVIPYSEGRYYNLSEVATERRLRFPPDTATPIAEPWDEDDWDHKITSWAGCLVMDRDSYWKAGGYPELQGWGYEDDCVRHALDVLVGHHQRVDGFVMHLRHPAPEAECFGNPDIDHNRAVARDYQRARTPQQMRAVIARHGPPRR